MLLLQIDPSANRGLQVFRSNTAFFKGTIEVCKSFFFKGTIKHSLLQRNTALSIIFSSLQVHRSPSQNRFIVVGSVLIIYINFFLLPSDRSGTTFRPHFPVSRPSHKSIVAMRCQQQLLSAAVKHIDFLLLLFEFVYMVSPDLASLFDICGLIYVFPTAIVKHKRLALLKNWMYDVEDLKFDVKNWMYDVEDLKFDVKNWMFDVEDWKFDVKNCSFY
ncbi:hypothetical protein L6452_23228 [Arctium lappa]|uniref:Uncharacterized protein n=1 Tax=Arctium lappa TaxID=4217 RepID=A0ACB9B2F0_ARCLA|nr:hypothetical protein L6452_23228 [Arctium lappa]